MERYFIWTQTLWSCSTFLILMMVPSTSLIWSRWTVEGFFIENMAVHCSRLLILNQSSLDLHWEHWMNQKYQIRLSLVELEYAKWFSIELVHSRNVDTWSRHTLESQNQRSWSNIRSFIWKFRINEESSLQSSHLIF